MLNAKNERVYVKYHFKTAQGIKNFTDEEAAQMKSKDMDFSQRDLIEHIENGDFPKWNLKIQVMSMEQSKKVDFNPFDLTKVWPHGDFPLIDVGVMELNENADNYFQDVEQSAFAPAHVVDGLGYSPDKMLQGRLLSYPDAHRYRLGTNYEQIPVNRCPYAVNNYQRDGSMRIDGNQGRKPNYFPNSFDDMEIDQSYNEPSDELDSNIADWYDRNSKMGGDDHYSQPGKLYREVMDEEAKTNLVNNTVGAMSGVEGPKKEEIINRQLCHWFRADEELGRRIAEGLNVNLDKVMQAMHEHHA